MSEPSFIAHCDEPSCDLGHVEYQCPACDRDGSDYADLWWDRDEIYQDRPVDFRCERCGASLRLQLDAERFAEVVCRPA